MEITIIIVLGCLILVDTILLTYLGIKQKNQQEKREKEKAENLADISKAEKASYLLLKKCFQDLEERINHLENMILPISNSIEVNARRQEKAIALNAEEQKKIGKIIVGRNKENADAIMNSNDELGEKISLVADKLYGIEENILALNVTETKQENGLNDEQYKEILNSLHRLEEDIKERLEDIARHSVENVPMSVTDILDDIQEQVAEIEPEQSFEPELTLEPEMVDELEPELTLEPEVEAIPEPEMIDELEPELTLEPEVEAIPEPEPIPEPILEVEPIPEPEPIPEVVESDMSDPNKMMSPDDIAALLASLSGDAAETTTQEEPEIELELEATSEPEIELEPETTPELEIELEPELELELEPELTLEPEQPEEKPAMPDMSDPNRVMTPDEIAALIANL